MWTLRKHSSKGKEEPQEPHIEDLRGRVHKGKRPHQNSACESAKFF